MAHPRAGPVEKPRTESAINWNPSKDAGLRGAVIERFATTEAVIDSLICSYYFGDHKPPREFLDDVLFDESFLFPLRRSVLEKILRREGLYDDKRMQDIHKMNRLRNQAAHYVRGHRRAELLAIAEDFLAAANRVEKFLHRGVVLKLGLRMHFDPLPTRKELLAPGGG